jgi:hypothetical protein
MVNPLVPEVNLKDDDSVDLIVEVEGIDSGNWAEISGYITQENGTFTPFSAIQQVPAPVGDGLPSVTVNVPALKLNPEADVTVITRVAEVQIWPTELKAGQAGQGVKAAWLAKGDNSAAAASLRQQGSLSSGNWRPAATMGATASGTLSQPSVTVVDLPNGTKITITVEAAGPG